MNLRYFERYGERVVGALLEHQPSFSIRVDRSDSNGATGFRENFIARIIDDEEGGIVGFYLCPKDVSFSLLPFSSPPLDYKVYKARIHIYFFETNEIDRIIVVYFWGEKFLAVISMKKERSVDTTRERNESA